MGFRVMGCCWFHALWLWLWFHVLWLAAVGVVDCWQLWLWVLTLTTVVTACTVSTVAPGVTGAAAGGVVGD